MPIHFCFILTNFYLKILFFFRYWIHTDWIKTNNLNQIDKNFLNNLKLENIDFTNVYTFYNSFVTAIIQYNGSKEVGENINLDSSKIQEIMDEIKSINYQITILKSQMDKEPNFNDKMDINIEINKLKTDKKLLQEQLSVDNNGKTYN